jgi:hypothetical protein
MTRRAFKVVVGFAVLTALRFTTIVGSNVYDAMKANAVPPDVNPIQTNEQINETVINQDNRELGTLRVRQAVSDIDFVRPGGRCYQEYLKGQPTSLLRECMDYQNANAHRFIKGGE